MKAIIVAGGKGERLKPLTNHIPKPMVEVGDKPILLHIIEHFKKNGIKDLIIALCYLPEVVTQFFGDGKKFGVKIEYTYEDLQKPLGTAGAITLAKNLINDTFIVTYADILRDLDIKKMVAFHKKSNALATINVYKRTNKNAKSKIIIDQDKRVTQFIERPNEEQLKGGFIWANGSLYILEPEIFNLIPANVKSDFGADIFPRLLKLKKTIYAYPTTDYFIDIGDLKKLEIARKTFK